MAMELDSRAALVIIHRITTALLKEPQVALVDLQ